MNTPCELSGKCGFFSNFKTDTGNITRSWRGMFCDSRERSERCVWKRVCRENGTAERILREAA